MPYTLGQAAKATGKSKPTILQAIRNGRLSATRDDKNQWQIDPAELDRVYPVSVNTERDETHNNTSTLQAAIEHLRELLSRTERERDELSRRLDDEADERRNATAEIRRLTLMLTHHQQPQQAANQNPRRAFKGWALAGLVVLLLIIAVLAASSLGLFWKQPG